MQEEEDAVEIDAMVDYNGPPSPVAAAETSDSLDPSAAADAAPINTTSPSSSSSHALGPRTTSSMSTGSRRTSPVYRYVVLRAGVDGDDKWICTVCEASEHLKAWSPPANTTNFKNHIQRYHAVEYAVIAPLIDAPSREPVDQLAVPEFGKQDQDRATVKLAQWLVADSHAFALVGQKGFIAFCRVLQPKYTVPTRQTIRSHILKMWGSTKLRVRAQIQLDLRGRSRVSITTDMWTSTAQRGYMVVTLQYIDNNWILKSVILAFVRVLYPHSGGRLAKAMVASIDELDSEIVKILWTVTADNASNNPVMVRSLNTEVYGRVLASEAPHPLSELATLERSPIVHHRCLAHVLQLAVKEGLKQC